MIVKGIGASKGIAVGPIRTLVKTDFPLKTAPDQEQNQNANVWKKLWRRPSRSFPICMKRQRQPDPIPQMYFPCIK